MKRNKKGTKKQFLICIYVICLVMTLRSVSIFAEGSHASNDINSVQYTEDSKMADSSEDGNQEDAKEYPGAKFNKDPKVDTVTVLGSFNNSLEGIDCFKDISIVLIGDNLTDDNYLSPEGLHWSDKTSVDLIKGSNLGVYDVSAFPQEAPNVALDAFSTNNGDSGRINFVGKTKSGIDLDLVWTVLGSDHDDWAQNSGFNDSRVKGLSFIGEQYFSGSTGNSIAVLYNNASNLALNYKVVKHGTSEEMPIIVSFISTDIDSGQGVQTDLANLVEIIPKESNLIKKDNVIYDTTPGVVNLNGASSLPRGGYLGAGFLSNFNYLFYSPAPERLNDTYLYPIAVRYDIFGSALQSNVLVKVRRHTTLEFIDTDNVNLRPNQYFNSLSNDKIIPKPAEIPNYKLVNIVQDVEDANHINIKFVYAPVCEVKIRFEDEFGNVLRDDHILSVVKSDEIIYTPNAIEGYITPDVYSNRIEDNCVYTFVYKKIKSYTSEPVKTTNYITVRDKIYDYKPSDYKVTKKIYKPLDYFCFNTGMSEEQKEVFFKFLDAVANDAKLKYGDDLNKINHDIANAIAYASYHEDTLQKLVNDFGDNPYTKHKKLSEKLGDLSLSEFFDELNTNPRYSIDFPHLACSLASAEDSGLTKHFIKGWAGISPFTQLSDSYDNFFLLNSLTGDVLTYMNDNDRASDIDAYIFHYDPLYSNMRLDHAIKLYYSTPLLHLNRENCYNEIIEEQVQEQRTNGNQVPVNYFASVLSAGGIALAIKTTLEKKNKIRNASPAEVKNAISTGVEVSKIIGGRLIENTKQVYASTAEVYKKSVEFNNDARKLRTDRIAKPITNFIKNSIEGIKGFFNGFWK